MKCRETTLPGVLLVEPEVFGDERGWFLETWREQRYRRAGIDFLFSQSNVSRSAGGVLRGLHFQWPEPQGKLVYVVQGAVWDVAVDIRPESPHFGQWFGATLDDRNHHQMWIPEGFAHGFQVTSETAIFCYFCTRPYQPEHDRAIAHDDPQLDIPWPRAPAGLSERDAAAPPLAAFERADLPSAG